MPELVLGLIGGVLGLLFLPVMVFLGGFQQAYTRQTTTLFAQAFVAGLMSIIGIVAAVFVKNRPKQSGIALVVSGIIGSIAALGFYVGGLLLLVAGILALVRKDSQVSEDELLLRSKQRSSKTGKRFCGQCGAELATDVRFCTNCGKEVVRPPS